MRVGVRLNEKGALQRRIAVLADMQVRRRAEVRRAKMAMDAHLALRQREIDNLKARLENVQPVELRVAQ